MREWTRARRPSYVCGTGIVAGYNSGIIPGYNLPAAGEPPFLWPIVPEDMGNRLTTGKMCGIFERVAEA